MLRALLLRPHQSMKGLRGAARVQMLERFSKQLSQYQFDPTE